VIDFFHEFNERHDRRNVLLCSDVLYADAFWREEMAELENFTSCRLQGIHRQKMNWQVDFLFGFNFGRRQQAGRSPNRFKVRRSWAFLRFVLKN
jgi:hypothetical protein